VLRIACCVFLLAACRFPGAIRPTVKIGLVAPFEGRYRYVGYDVIYAVRLALREANAAGGVGGYNVELVAYDDAADPDQATEQARKLAVDPDVVAAIGHFREETTVAALRAYVEAGIPLLAPAVLAPGLGQGEAAVYRLGPPVQALAEALLERVEAGSSPAGFALVTGGGPLGVALAAAAAQRQVPVLAVASLSDPAWLQVVSGSGANLVLCDADPVGAGEAVAALREAGWDGLFLGGPDLAAADFSAVAGEAAAGALFITPWPFPTDVPGSAGFVAAYRALSPDVPPPGPLALPAYEATWVLLEALEQDIAAHGTATREGVAAALADVKRNGLLGRITFGHGLSWDTASLRWYRVGTDGVARPADVSE
jgi:branched-chain amino acid transport system substrate-binding protein